MSRLNNVRYLINFDNLGKQIALYQSPTPKETNLLFILAEAGGAEVHYDQICARLNRSRISVQVAATRLRKKLSEDWIVHGVTGKGLQLLYVPFPYRAPDIMPPDDPRVQYVVVDDNFRKHRRERRKRRVRLYD